MNPLLLQHYFAPPAKAVLSESDGQPGSDALAPVFWHANRQGHLR